MKSQKIASTIKAPSNVKTLQTNQLSLTQRQPQQRLRKMYKANLNLKSSVSLKRLQQQKNKRYHTQVESFTDQQNSMDPFEEIDKHNIQNSSKNSQFSKETVKKLQGSRIKDIKTLNNRNPKQNHKQPINSKKSLGEWIQPKQKLHEKRNLENLNRTQPHNFSDFPSDQKRIDDLNIEQNSSRQLDQEQFHENSMNKLLSVQHPSLKNMQWLEMDDEQQSLMAKDFKTQTQRQPPMNFSQTLLNQSSSLLYNHSQGNQIIQRSAKKIIQPLEKKKCNVRRAESIISTTSVKSYDSPVFNRTAKSPKTSRFMKLSLTSEEIKRQKKYSRFKNVIEEEKQKKQWQRGSSMTQELMDDSQNSAFILPGPETSKLRQNKLLAKGALKISQILPQSSIKSRQQLPACHFSYNSPDNYVKKYQQLTSTPIQFQKSLKQLKLVEEDQEHQYFRYEKNQKKLTYYNLAEKRKKEGTKKNKGNSALEENQLSKRRLKYESFVEQLKKKSTQSILEPLSSLQCKEIEQTFNQINLNDVSQEIISLVNKQESHSQTQRMNENSQICSKINKNQQNSYKQLYLNSYLKQDEKSTNQQVGQSFSFEQNQPHQKQVQQISQKQIVLMFKKKDDRIKRLQNKISRVRSLGRQLFEENQRIDKEFQAKRLTWMERIGAKLPLKNADK